MPNLYSTNSAESDRRLDTWKEIGAFFGRDERTVKRWEVDRGLPVHRVPGKRGMVYAYTRELDDWLRGSEASAAEEGPANSTDLRLNPGELESPAEIGADLPIPSFQQEATQMSPRFRRTVPTYVVASLLILTILVAVPAAVTLHFRSERRVPHQHTVNAEAQEFYLKGEYYLQKRSGESLTRAVDNFTQAIVRDPAYAEAYAGLANCYNLLREYTLMPASEAYPRALAAAKQAVALDDSLSSAHSALGFVDFYWLWDSRAAEQQYQRALALDPNSVEAHHWYATFLLHQGRFHQALAEIDQAQRLDPSSVSILADKGLILFFVGEREEGIDLLEQLESTDPGFLSPHNYLAGIDLNTGKYLQYLREAQLAASMVHDEDRLSVLEAGQQGYSRAGERGMLQAELEAQAKLYGVGKLPAYSLADTYARLGQQRQALQYLHVAYSRHESDVVSLRVDPGLETLHATPEYRRLLAEAGFSPDHK